ncbi:MAG: hypothetical protein GYB41_13615 [Oceanospirillales bacterium]|uniref:Uncharacterized protein n=1 Tax=Marinobacterium halophilum TaxID=267374 RepID=A0A2P8F504_9GAMM|nr:hypothetical protein [Marinobacterium halophilum]MBR9829656.1 hypothetical protein [Oceanospirillales bacterium]PSL16796.1 hypothetical protein CLV44_101196 [Marinobacterium halophilum]
MFKINKLKLFPTNSHPQGRGVLPWYECVGQKVFRSYGHPEGASTEAEFLVQADRLIPLLQRDAELPGAPWFIRREDRFYPGYGHPQGGGRLPWFEIRH